LCYQEFGFSCFFTVYSGFDSRFPSPFKLGYTKNIIDLFSREDIGSLLRYNVASQWKISETEYKIICLWEYGKILALQATVKKVDTNK
jgi:hypothetical protein